MSNQIQRNFLGFQFIPSGGGGSLTFTDLTDTPANYTGQSLKIVRVNASETALEFTTISSGSGTSIGLNLAMNQNLQF